MVLWPEVLVDPSPRPPFALFFSVWVTGVVVPSAGSGVPIMLGLCVFFTIRIVVRGVTASGERGEGRRGGAEYKYHISLPLRGIYV